jgi:hypothetical protein
MKANGKMEKEKGEAAGGPQLKVAASPNQLPVILSTCHRADGRRANICATSTQFAEPQFSQISGLLTSRQQSKTRRFVISWISRMGRFQLLSRSARHAARERTMG